MELTDLKLAQICQIAYCEPSVAIPAYGARGYVTISKFFGKHVQYYVLVDEFNVIYAIRGTNRPRDWFQNFMIEQDHAAFGSVHSGFYKGANQVAVDPTHKADLTRKVIFTGHSKGGSVAILLSFMHSCDSVTFGASMVGRLGKLRQTKIKNYVNNMDIVPRIPSGVLGYKPTEERIYFNYYGQVCRPTAWQLFLDRMRSRYKAITKKQKFDDFYDHNIDEYIEKLRYNNL